MQWEPIQSCPSKFTASRTICNSILVSRKQIDQNYSLYLSTAVLGDTPSHAMEDVQDAILHFFLCLSWSHDMEDVQEEIYSSHAEFGCNKFLVFLLKIFLCMLILVPKNEVIELSTTRLSYLPFAPLKYLKM